MHRAWVSMHWSASFCSLDVTGSWYGHTQLIQPFLLLLMDSRVISRLVLCKNWIFHTKIDEICVLVGLLKIIIKFAVLIMIIIAAEGFPGDSESKESACNAGPTLKMKVKSLSHIWLFAALWTVTHQTPLFMGISRQEYWSGLPFPS